MTTAQPGSLPATTNAVAVPEAAPGCGPCDAQTCGTCARLSGLTSVPVGPGGLCAKGHRTQPDRVIVLALIAAACVDGLISAQLAVQRLVREAGCTPDGAARHVTGWQQQAASRRPAARPRAEAVTAHA